MTYTKQKPSAIVDKNTYNALKNSSVNQSSTPDLEKYKIFQNSKKKVRK